MVLSRLAIALLCVLILAQCEGPQAETHATDVVMPTIDTTSIAEEQDILEGGFFMLDELLRCASPRELEDRYGVGVLLHSPIMCPLDSCVVLESYRLFDNGTSSCYWQECQCPDSRVRLAWAHTDSLESPGEWRTRSGLYLGMPTDQLNILNGRPVSLKLHRSGSLVSDSYRDGAFHSKATGFALGSSQEDSLWRAGLSHLDGLHTRSRELRRFQPRVSSVWVWRILE